MNETGLFSLVRMARRIGVTAKWLREEAISGRIPCLVADKRLLFSESAVGRCLRERADVIASGVAEASALEDPQ